MVKDYFRQTFVSLFEIVRSNILSSNDRNPPSCWMLERYRLDISVCSKLSVVTFSFRNFPSCAIKR